MERGERLMRQHRDSAFIVVPDADDYTDILLDEWDTYIAAYEEAVCDIAEARRVLAELREPMAVIEAETLLTVEGRAEAEGRARALLALRWHDGWRGYQREAQAARERMHEAARRASVARMRAGLVRMALTVALRRDGAQT
jgi:hypothetical protein